MKKYILGLLVIGISGCSNHTVSNTLPCDTSMFQGVQAAGFCAKSYAVKVCSQYAESISTDSDHRFAAFQQCTDSASKFLTLYHPDIK